MKILFALKSGLWRSLKAWKVVLVFWFIYLSLVSILAMPMKGAFSSALGSSMITEKFSDGLNLEVLTDMGGSFKSILSFLNKGLIFMMLINVVLSSFLSGGLFRTLALKSFSRETFWKGAADNFWSFFIISLIFNIIILILFLGVVILPLSFMISAGSIPDYTIMKSAIGLIFIFFLFMAILLSAADYARAWQSGIETNRCFAAIGFGFSQTFRTFLSSWPLMLILLVIQALFLIFVLKIFTGIIPSTGKGVFIFFIFSQLLFFIRLMIKAFRYGSMISMLE
jgi:hypothetical protein